MEDKVFDYLKKEMNISESITRRASPGAISDITGAISDNIFEKKLFSLYLFISEYQISNVFHKRSGCDKDFLKTFIQLYIDLYDHKKDTISPMNKIMIINIIRKLIEITCYCNSCKIHTYLDINKVEEYMNKIYQKLREIQL